MKRKYIHPMTEAVGFMSEQLLLNLSSVEIDDDPNKDVVKGDEWSNKKHPIWGDSAL